MRLDAYIDAASALQQNISLMDANVEVGITNLSQEISKSVGDCASINSQYEKLKEVLCGGGNPGIATGLEGAWGVLFVVSLLWIPLLFCMCQAKKHADQVRYGRLELRADMLEKDQPVTGDTVNVRILLGAPFNNVADNKVARICMEVQDRLAMVADIPPKYFKVTSQGANNSIFPLDICVQLGRFWISNPAQSPLQSERDAKILTFVGFLKASAENSFQENGNKSVGSWYKAPWRGFFPRNPLLSTVKLEVVGDNNVRTINPRVSAPVPFPAENPEPVFYSQAQITQDSKNQIKEEINNRSGERIEIETSLRPTEYKSTGADFMFQPPVGIPSAPTLEEIQEGSYQPSAACQVTQA
uniref:Uncharacterized protein n=1 Tax=Cryptomonas curvata TaxID=233186 RepID=A0A7S0MSJ9_9CRYP|mmetsp:Transcript_52915/g.110346  ORF Transcript_52915/g.110346 Transcript_52915/m.110346 type:complete len:357 (+) Transcript_52915:1279-2349(+)